ERLPAARHRRAHRDRGLDARVGGGDFAGAARQRALAGDGERGPGAERVAGGADRLQVEAAAQRRSLTLEPRYLVEHEADVGGTGERDPRIGGGGLERG